MNPSKSQGLLPLQQCKILHLVRHAEGFHNQEGEKNYDAYLSYEFFDSQLNPLGWHQTENLREKINASGIPKRIDLVVVSPLLRTLQTAVGVFGGEAYQDGIEDAPPLMVAKAGKSDRPAVSSLNCPPFISVELCREEWGVYPCDKRRNIGEYKTMFPAIDFSLIENDEDVFWKEDVKETVEEVAARGLKFINWLLTREENEIAVVSHSEFLFHMLNAFTNDRYPSIKNDLCEPFANCELRSMVIMDRNMTGLDRSSADYQREVPRELQVSCNAEDLRQEKAVSGSHKNCLNKL